MWQAGSMALLAAAIGLAALPLGRILGAGKYEAPTGATVAGGDVKPVTMTATDVMRTADSMQQIAGKVDVAPAPPPPMETETTTETTEVKTPPAAPTTWAYIGYMSGLGAETALVRIGPSDTGTQVMLRQGQEHEGTKVVEVKPDHLIVEKAGARERIDLTQRTLAWDTTPPRQPAAARPGGPNAAATMGVPGANGGRRPNFPPNTSAAALAESQRRMKAALSPQTQMDWQKAGKEMGEFGQDKRDALMKVLAEPGLSSEERGKLLREMGIPTEGTPEERMEFMKSVGVTPDSDPKLYEMLKEGGGSK